MELQNGPINKIRSGVFRLNLDTDSCICDHRRRIAEPTTMSIFPHSKMNILLKILSMQKKLLFLCNPFQSIEIQPLDTWYIKEAICIQSETTWTLLGLI